MEADTGAMGGTDSHEFMVLASSGEDQILYCDPADTLPMRKKLKAAYRTALAGGKLLPGEELHTPGIVSIEDLQNICSFPEKG